MSLSEGCAQQNVYTANIKEVDTNDDKSNNYYYTHDCQPPQSWTRD